MFSSLNNLLELELDHNLISIIPNEISQCSNLKILNLSHNLIAVLPPGNY